MDSSINQLKALATRGNSISSQVRKLSIVYLHAPPRRGGSNSDPILEHPFWLTLQNVVQDIVHHAKTPYETQSVMRYLGPAIASLTGLRSI